MKDNLPEWYRGLPEQGELPAYERTARRKVLVFKMPYHTLPSDGRAPKRMSKPEREYVGMGETLGERIWAWIHETFPERQLYVRSDGRVQFFTFAPPLLATLALIALIVVGWLVFSTTSVFLMAVSVERSNNEAALVLQQEEGARASARKELSDAKYVARQAWDFASAERTCRIHHCSPAELKDLDRQSTVLSRRLGWALKDSQDTKITPPTPDNFPLALLFGAVRSSLNYVYRASVHKKDVHVSDEMVLGTECGIFLSLMGLLLTAMWRSLRSIARHRKEVTEADLPKST